MKKKLVAMLLMTAMTCSALAGCGSDAETADGAENAAEEVADDAEADAEPVEVDEDGKVDGLMYAEGLPIVDEGDYSFSIFCDDSSSTGEFYMMDVLKEQTNVDVDLRIMPYETATERLNLDLNSGDYADVIGGWTLSDSMILTYGVDQGVFIPLEDIFEQYCPNISAILDLPGVREEMTAPDGHIYTIPYVCGDTTVGYSPWINDEWLENVGMEMPTTTDEFADVLRAFKNQDANGNGDPTDEIPFSTDPNNKHLEAMAGYFGLPLNKYGFSIVDGETVYGGTSSQYREFLSWFNGLYEEGLIDLEIFTQDSATWEGKGNQDMYGVSIAYGSSEFSGEVAAPEKGKFSALPVLNADNGGVWLRDTPGNSVYRTQAVITDNAEHPEIIARWFDNAFELENGIGCSRGPIDVVVFKEGDGYRAIDTSTLDEETQEKVSWSNLWPQSLPKYMPIGFEYIEDNPMYDEKKNLEEYYEPYLTEDAIPSFWISLDAVETYSEIATSIQDYFNQQQALFVSGELDVDDDAVWEEYKQGFEDLGLADYLEVRGVSTVIE
ncbi:MAG: extracellular solute-binding protein [Lachnospiraceae bacterium]|nr:extracellular solute-binding protein [Lachnospiraceae bacterium]